MQYFLEAYTVLRFNMHLGSLDHAFLNKTACLTHGLLKFHAIHSIRSDNGGKQISGSTAFLKNTVRPNHPGFPVLFIHEVCNKLSLWNSGNHHLLRSIIRQMFCHPE